MAEGYHPGPVPKEALDFFRAKGFKVGFDHRDVWKKEHIHAFTVAKATQMDLLRDIRDAADKALKKGETFHQFKKQLTPTLQKKGWWGVREIVDPKTGETVKAQLGSPRRLKTIYRTNMRTSRAAGQWERIQRTKKHRPFLLYSLGPSRVHRAQHLSWSQLILPVDHPFWNTHYPPNGWGCKCRIRQISAREAEYLGGVSPDPVIQMRKWENRRTGETVYVVRGIDPGWDYNPGASRLSQAAKRVMDTVTEAPADLGAAVAAQLPGDAATALADDVREWILDIRAGRLSRTGGRRVVGAMSPETVRGLKTLGVDPKTAAITLEQRSVNHLFAHGRKGENALPEHLVPEIADLIRHPVAVIWDSQGKRPALLYAVKVPKVGKAGQIVIRVNFTKGDLVTNAVRSAGTVLPHQLKKPGMILLEGKIE